MLCRSAKAMFFVRGEDRSMCRLVVHPLFRLSRRLVAVSCLFSAAGLSAAAQGSKAVQPALVAEAMPAAAESVPSVALPPPSEALADTLSERGRYLAAIRTYEALPPTPEILNKLGIACEHMLLFDKARTNFEASLKLNPKYAEPYNNLGTLAHSQGDLRRAEKMYRKALKIKPESASTLRNLGTLYYAQQKYKKGDNALKQAVALDPLVLERGNNHAIQARTRQSVSDVHYHMALTYAQAGSNDLAMQYLRKAIGEGFHDRNRLLHEKDFADLRTHPKFLEMVDDLSRN